MKPGLKIEITVYTLSYFFFLGTGRAEPIPLAIKAGQILCCFTNKEM